MRRRSAPLPDARFRSGLGDIRQQTITLVDRTQHCRQICEAGNHDPNRQAVLNDLAQEFVTVHARRALVGDDNGDISILLDQGQRVLEVRALENRVVVAQQILECREDLLLVDRPALVVSPIARLFPWLKATFGVRPFCNTEISDPN